MNNESNRNVLHLARPHARPTRHRQDREIKNIVNYGSEEDSDNEGEEEDGQLIVVPKTARLYLQDMADEEEATTATAVNTVPCYHWSLPPTLKPSTSTSPVCSTATPPPAMLSSSGSGSPPPLSGASTYGPQDKWLFDWRAFPQPTVPPTARRETFNLSNCGPQESFQSPYEAFTSIWTLEIMEHIARETNRYAQEVATVMLDTGSLRPASRIINWRDTTADELYVYFAIILATGIAVKSRLEEYWSKDRDLFSTPGFSCAMGYDRFHLLSKCLHFQDNAVLDHQLMTRSQAKLFKLQPILDHLNDKFSTLYKMRQNVVLDESLTQWKGWLDINQFIHNKASTDSIKTFEICESQSGYLWRFEVHAGHDPTAAPQETPMSGIIPALILRLLHGLEDKGYTIWVDNLYNSPALARELKSRGFDCVGTLRTNRQFVPARLASLNKNEMVPGQIVGCTSGDVDVILWRDLNRVALLSTYHGLATWECEGVKKPTLIHDYNISMAGIDRKDQMLAMYPIERKRTRIWYKKLFGRLLNASVLNAYILHKHDHHSVTHRDFRKQLCRQLLSTHCSPQPPETTGQHFPAIYAHHRAHAGKKTEPLRRVCKFCKKRTATYCEECNVTLCLYECFKQYHITLNEQHT